METYLAMKEQHNNQMRDMARMWGADVESSSGESDFDRIARNIQGENEDITQSPIRAKGGESFGVGFGLGYSEVE